jgi:uncharacterized protein (TIGR03083 family)
MRSDSGIGSAIATDADPDPDPDVKGELLDLADLLEESPSSVWDAPSLCQGWRTREVVAHMTMPARYSPDEFMNELSAAGGDFTKLSDTIAARDGALPVSELLAGMRSHTLHSWEPPGGGVEGALTHCVVHGLDVSEAVGCDRTVPAERIRRVLDIVAGPDGPNLFGTDLTGIELRADDLEWSVGSGEVLAAPAQVLALVVCGRRVPPGRLRGSPAARFTR